MLLKFKINKNIFKITNGEDNLTSLAMMSTEKGIRNIFNLNEKILNNLFLIKTEESTTSKN